MRHTGFGSSSRDQDFEPAVWSTHLDHKQTAVNSFLGKISATFSSSQEEFGGRREGSFSRAAAGNEA